MLSLFLNHQGWGEVGGGRKEGGGGRGGRRWGREEKERRREAKARLCFRKCQKKKGGVEADTTW